MDIDELLKAREILRQKKKFNEADNLRKQIEERGYQIIDSQYGSRLIRKYPTSSHPLGLIGTSGKIALFGSGEMSPSGRRVHEYLIKGFTPPVKIVLLPTPAGFEENPRVWYGKLQKTLEVGLRNFRPEIFYLDALRKDGEKSTNDPKLLKSLADADYIHTGAGSPSYTVWHLANSLVYQKICERAKVGAALSFASAAAIAVGKFCLPVYEIYKAGQELFWLEGLDFFGQWGLNLTVIPHWDNKEGGREIDTSFCYMGQKRFSKLKKILPGTTNILCIAEQTAAIFDVKKEQMEIFGNGNVCLIRKPACRQAGNEEKIFPPGQKISFADLK